MRENKTLPSAGPLTTQSAVLEHTLSYSFFWSPANPSADPFADPSADRLPIVANYVPLPFAGEEDRGRNPWILRSLSADPSPDSPPCLVDTFAAFETVYIIILLSFSYPSLPSLSLLSPLLIFQSHCYCAVTVIETVNVNPPSL